MAWAELRELTRGKRAELVTAATNPRAAQEGLLREILARHQECVYGRRWQFSNIKSLADYRNAVPICDYEQLTANIEQMANGTPDVLVSEAVSAFELTGGSSGGAKRIPLTASGLAYIQRGLYAWLDDLLTHESAVAQGRSYWSLSPALCESQVTAGGIPIGLSNDAEYFGSAAGAILDLLVTPPVLALLGDIETWRCITLQCLLADETLAFVSIWSPTFWLELMKHAQIKRTVLIDGLRYGRWAVPVPGKLAHLLPAPAKNPARAALVDAALAQTHPDWRAIWPKLAVISCWTHASSAPWATRLAAQFPNVRLQGKGLLATEGMVSLPILETVDPVLALNSSVVEFEDESGRVYACDELNPGSEYDILLTTSAGLYRYRLGDRVRVTGWWNAAPQLRLLGRAGIVSDLCGEKLNDAFVTQCWTSISNLPARLTPITLPHPHYRLWLDTEVNEASALATALEQALRANPQYAYARDLGQLLPIVPYSISGLAARLQTLAIASGQRLGDAKPQFLGKIDDPDFNELAS